MMTGNYDILFMYSLGKISAKQAIKRLHITDEQVLNKMTLDAQLPLPKLSEAETNAMQKRFGEMLDNASRLGPWFLEESANKILCKHQFHKAFDQEFTYKADPVAKRLNVHVKELDIMLLKWFLYIHVLGLIDPALKQIDDYKIIVDVANRYSFSAVLKRSEHDWQQDTVVLTPLPELLSETLRRDPEAGFALMQEIAKVNKL